jgi:hypothetical protein
MGGFVADQTRGPAAYAADIDAARERMIAFVAGCTEQEWRAAPLDGDPRAVAVVVDHVAPPRVPAKPQSAAMRSGMRIPQWN